MSQIKNDSISIEKPEKENEKLIEKEEIAVTFDEALMKAGGFGIFQVFQFIFLTLTMITSGYLFYALPYLELFPDYICPPNIPNCDHTDYCKDKSIPIDWDSVRSLHNWVDKLNLDCAEGYEIGLIGSMYFAGWMVASFIVPRYGDVYGRKWPCWLSLLWSFPIYLGLVLSENIHLTQALFFLQGMAQCGRYQIAYVFITELTPYKYRNYVGSANQFMDSFTIMLVAVYFRFVSKDWLPFQIYGLSAHFASLIAVFFIPESPKFLYSKGKYDQARKSLQFIAKFNRVKKYEPVFKFDDEILIKDTQDITVMPEHSQLSHIKQSQIYEQIAKEQDSKLLGRSKMISGIKDASFVDQDLLKDKHEGTMIQKKKGTLKELFRNKLLMPNLLIFIWLWIVGSFSYNMILFQLKYLEGDIYINAIVAAGAEMCAYAVVSFFLQKFGIKVTYCCAFSVGAIGSILYIIFGHDNQQLVAVFILGAAFGVSSSVITNWTSTVQLFPVIYASTTIGACNALCRLFNILVPQFAEIAQPLPMIVVASSCVTAAVVVLFMNTDAKKLTKL